MEIDVVVCDFRKFHRIQVDGRANSAAGDQMKPKKRICWGECKPDLVDSSLAPQSLTTKMAVEAVLNSQRAATGRQTESTSCC